MDTKIGRTITTDLLESEEPSQHESSLLEASELERIIPEKQTDSIMMQILTRSKPSHASIELVDGFSEGEMDEIRSSAVAHIQRTH